MSEAWENTKFITDYVEETTPSNTDAILIDQGSGAYKYAEIVNLLAGNNAKTINGTINTTVKIGNTVASNAVFAHTDNYNSTDYAIRQNSGGATLMNCKSGQFLGFYQGGSIVGQFDANGNVGIGVTPESWSQYTALQLGGNGSFSATTAQGASGGFHIGQNIYYNSGWKYISTDEASLYKQGDGSHTFYVAGSGSADTAVSTLSAAMTINNSGAVDCTKDNSAGALNVKGASTQWGNVMFRVISDTTGTRSIAVYAVSNSGYNGGATAMQVGKNSTTGRSINAGGTINASGADYAEYEYKANHNTLFEKGQVVGFDINGKLTDKWDKSISFGVISTNPAYIGGDTWANVEVIGHKPVKKEEGNKDKHKKDLKNYEKIVSDLEKTVAIVAYAGKVPVDIESGSVGDYVIPINVGNSIKGVAVTNPTFEQYRITVGQIRTIKDGIYIISVKVN